MLRAQSHRCAICAVLQSDKRAYAVDHCHESGAIRGVLCGFCNTALGHYEAGWRPGGAIRAFERYLATGAAATSLVLLHGRKGTGAG